MVSRSCQVCGARFVTSDAKIRNGHGRFCSRECFWVNRKANHVPKPGIYGTVLNPQHPLARGGNGKLWEHRVALYDKIGPGVHPCHHCGELVEWTFGIRRGGLVVDHLDGDKRNNSPQNLVPSCNRCNCHVRAGKMIQPDELFVMDSGSRKRAVELECPCGKKYLKAKSQAKRSKYCSTDCRYRNSKILAEGGTFLVTSRGRRLRAVRKVCACGAEYLTRASRASTSRGCSITCANKNRKLP